MTYIIGAVVIAIILVGVVITLISRFDSNANSSSEEFNVSSLSAGQGRVADLEKLGIKWPKLKTKEEKIKEEASRYIEMYFNRGEALKVLKKKVLDSQIRMKLLQDEGPCHMHYICLRDPDFDQWQVSDKDIVDELEKMTDSEEETIQNQIGEKYKKIYRHKVSLGLSDATVLYVINDHLYIERLCKELRKYKIIKSLDWNDVQTALYMSLIDVGCKEKYQKLVKIIKTLEIDYTTTIYDAYRKIERSLFEEYDSDNYSKIQKIGKYIITLLLIIRLQDSKQEDDRLLSQ